MKYKHIRIERVKAPEKQPHYAVLNNRTNDRLGDVWFYPGWRRYIFTVESHMCVFSASCLRDIIQFIDNEAGKE